MTVSPVGPEHKNCRATKHRWTVARQLSIIIIIIIINIINANYTTIFSRLLLLLLN